MESQDLQMTAPHIHSSKNIVLALSGMTNKPIMKSDMDKLSMIVLDTCFNLIQSQ